MIEVDDLTILTGWAEAVAEALAYAPARAQAVLADARPGAPWRRDLGIAEPSARLSDAIDSIERALSAAIPPAARRHSTRCSSRSGTITRRRVRARQTGAPRAAINA